MHRTVMSSVRSDLRLIYESSVNAVKPNQLIKKFIEIKDNYLLIKNFSQKVEKKVFLANRNVYILGAGKAVLRMCEEFVNQLEINNNAINGQKCFINKGLLSVPMGADTGSSLSAKYNVIYKTGAQNNMPDMDSEKTTLEIIDLVKSAKISAKTQSICNKPLIISFISGGGSALLSLPKPEITLEEKCSLIGQLVKSGATIDELNSVRRCLSRVKCGKLANLAISEPNCVQMICFIVSDIINDPLELIASGPTIISRSDATKPSEKALKILNKFNIKTNDKIISLIKSEDTELDSFDSNSVDLLDNIMIGNNTIALNMAENTAKQLGYKVIFLGNAIKGEASDVATNLARIGIDYKESEEEIANYRGICWVGGGETTVDMTDSKTGLGGRCQEMCLSFYRQVYGLETNAKLYLMCAGTDGQDGPTDVAGVIAENVSKTVDSNEDIFRESKVYLSEHNSHHFFKNYYNNWFIKTGITGTNVMDIYCMIKYFN